MSYRSFKFLALAKHLSNSTNTFKRVPRLISNCAFNSLSAFKNSTSKRAINVSLSKFCSTLPNIDQKDDPNLTVSPIVELQEGESTVGGNRMAECDQGGIKKENEITKLELDMELDLVIKLRGLPWSCTEDDIIDFLGTDCNICDNKNGVHLITTSEGRSSGEAFVECRTEDDMTEAIKKDKRTMGHRYIEVFKVKRAEMEWVLRRNRPSGPVSTVNFGDDADTFVRMRGLPFECTKSDICQFFSGLEIVPNGVQLMVDGMGRNSGEAYAQFNSKAEADKALQRDRQCIGHRYIEIFRVAPSELKNIDMLVSRTRPSFSRPGPYDRGPPGMGTGGNAGLRFGSMGNNMGGGGGGPSGRPSRYFANKEDSWNSYANEVGSWNRVNPPNAPPPPPPPPLLQQLKQQRMLGAGQTVLMRGLPFRSTEDDIRKFFEPLMPNAIHIIYDDTGRPSGTAKVSFNTMEEANRAMSKHKERIGHRYIELFMN